MKEKNSYTVCGVFQILEYLVVGVLNDHVLPPSVNQLRSSGGVSAALRPLEYLLQLGRYVYPIKLS